MQNEDQALFEVRIDLRNLRAAAYNYQRIQKENIELAYRLVEGALQAFSQPQAPAGFAGPPGLVGPTAGIPQAGDPAALTLQLLSVQAALLTAQNDLYTTWTSFLATRMALYRDLGIMPLDSRGVWIDNHAAECECNSGTSAQAPLRPVPGQGLPLPFTPSTAPPSGFPEQLPPPRNLPPVPPAPGGGT